MDLGLEGRVGLVLGAGGGLGGAIAQSLSREGVKVAVADVNEAAVVRTAQSIRAAGGIVHPLRWDLSNIPSIEECVSAVETALGSVDILINITGGPPPSPASGNEAETWRRNFESMVLSVIKIVDRVLPHMRAQKWGRIVTSASSGVIAPIPDLALSNALRSALVGWSKTLAREVAKDGITVNLVVPGRISTDRIRMLDASKAQREGRSLEDVVSASVGSIPAGRYGTPEEYADVVAFLASRPASYVTGSIVRVDGGYIPSI